ncbi:RNA polymerase sigma factor [Lysobacter sp. A3-1-A15]|uniref:RNA polymerase sigma factor n=1 Tax=Novilysobacter viscosus TaxID=3098602 RepID=UPI002EDB374B
MEIAAHMKDATARGQFEALLGRHRGLVFKVAHSYSRDAEDRADLAQEIAAQLWRAWPSYDPRRPLATWMYRIALNVGISHLRGRSRHDAHHVPLDEDHHGIAGGQGAEEGLQLQALQRLIAGFDPLNRALLLLYLDERSHREIAEILGLTETNVATRIGRLKQRLRERLCPKEG